LKLAFLVSGVLALAKLGFLDFITGGFDTGRFGGVPLKLFEIQQKFISNPCDLSFARFKFVLIGSKYQ
jgi:hypothetical protein